MPLADRGGTRTRWRVWGQGGREVFLVHAMLLRSAHWEDLAGRLGPGLRITAFDLPSHGESGAWRRAEDYLDQTVAMAGALAGMAPPVDLVGHSFGGVAALALALRRPELVRSLTLIEPVLFAAAPPAVLSAYLDRMTPFRDAMEAGDPARAARFFHGVWGAGDWDAIPPDRQTRMAARMELVEATVPVLFEDAAGLLAPGRLEALEVPVLLMAGSASPPVVAAIGDTLAARLPDARCCVIDGAGHMLPLTHPGAVAGAMAWFLGLREAPGTA